jgi:hypothetical protein
MHCKRLVSLGKSLSMQCIAKKTCKPWVRTLRKKGAQLRQKEEEEEEEEEKFSGGPMSEGGRGSSHAAEPCSDLPLKISASLLAFTKTGEKQQGSKR